MNISETPQTGMDAISIRPSPVEQSSAIIKPEQIRSDPTQKQTENAEEKLAPKLSTKLSREETEELVEALEDLAQTIQTKLNFSINEPTNDIVVKIMDKETDTIIKQFPAEELLELQEKMIDLASFLFDTDV